MCLLSGVSRGSHRDRQSFARYTGPVGNGSEEHKVFQACAEFPRSITWPDEVDASSALCTPFRSTLC